MTLALGSDSIFAGQRTGNALARWLEQVPPGASTLTVAVRDGDASSHDVVARWPLPDCDPGAWSVVAVEWGQRIQALMADCAQESRRTAHGIVRWLDVNGGVLAARRVVVRYQGDGEEDFSREATTSATLGLVMQHQQVLMEQLTAVTQHNVIESAKRAERAYEQLIALEVENQKMRDEIERLRAEQVSDEADRVIADAVDTDPVAERAGKLIEMLMLKWISEQGGPKLPPSTSTPPATPTE